MMHDLGGRNEKWKMVNQFETETSLEYDWVET